MGVLFTRQVEQSSHLWQVVHWRPEKEWGGWSGRGVSFFVVLSYVCV